MTQTILNETKTLIETSLTLPKDSMEPGLYKATLFSQFTSFTGQPFISDFAYMEFKLPALIPKITNSEGASNPTRTVFVDSIISLDSSRSEDPAVGLTSVSSLPMVRSWKCWTGTITREQVEQLLSSGTPISTATTNCDSLMDSAGKENQTINLPSLPVPSVHMLLLLLLLLMLLLHKLLLHTPPFNSTSYVTTFTSTNSTTSAYTATNYKLLRIRLLRTNASTH